jgi:hypothetical protein
MLTFSVFDPRTDARMRKEDLDGVFRIFDLETYVLPCHLYSIIFNSFSAINLFPRGDK